jgi:DNA-binding NtrC family response regulator
VLAQNPDNLFFRKSARLHLHPPFRVMDSTHSWTKSQGSGHREASDGESALAEISETHFDLVISDWNMEPMNAGGLPRQVRANKKYAKLPFIMMTADCAVDKIVFAKRAGVSCFINKPFSAEGFQTKISEINKRW